jgi:hypothetical protein
LTAQFSHTEFFYSGQEGIFEVEAANGNDIKLNLKTSVDFIAEAQRCRVTQRKSEVLWGNEKYKNFSDGVNLHQLGVACMVLYK